MVCNGGRDAPQDRRADGSATVRAEHDDPGISLLGGGEDGCRGTVLFADRRAGVEPRRVCQLGALSRRPGGLLAGECRFPCKAPLLVQSSYWIRTSRVMPYLGNCRTFTMRTSVERPRVTPIWGIPGRSCAGCIPWIAAVRRPTAPQPPCDGLDQALLNARLVQEIRDHA